MSTKRASAGLATNMCESSKEPAAACLALTGLKRVEGHEHFEVHSSRVEAARDESPISAGSGILRDAYGLCCCIQQKLATSLTDVDTATAGGLSCKLSMSGCLDVHENYLPRCWYIAETQRYR